MSEFNIGLSIRNPQSPIRNPQLAPPPPPPRNLAPVLILGGGINGAAIARELAVEGFGVCLVDTADLAYGATAYSSRLIHGGLRYLEYGEFDLVRESLAERTRLLKLAPQYVRPLKLFVPVERRFTGLGKTLARFLRMERAGGGTKTVPPRGLWLVRMGLRMYDMYARDPSLPTHATHAATDPAAPRVDPQRYRWLCSYYDAQVRYPERLVVALLDDARRAAAEHGSTFEVFTYHEATLAGQTATIRPRAGGEAVRSFEPAAIVNATGAWVDDTLQRLAVSSPKLMGGTKGSHLLSASPRLREALGGSAVYAEASDGRPVFVLPLGPDWTLIGTTDLRYEGDPGDAVCTVAERDYLIDTVNRILPAARLAAADIEWHYSGVRPLPHVGASSTAAVTRRHWLQEHAGAAVPLYSVIGGKLTTCRSLAESTVDTLAARLERPRQSSTRERPLPGAESYPAEDPTLAARQQRLAVATGCSAAQIAAMWALCGPRIEQIVIEFDDPSRENVPGTHLPTAFVRWVIEHEWATRLADLVERRLMLLYEPQLSRHCLTRLAELLKCNDVEGEVATVERRLRDHFGKQLVEG